MDANRRSHPRLDHAAIALGALAVVAGLVAIADTGSAHASAEHGELTFHGSEDGPPTDALTCRFWIDGSGMSHANATIQVVHDRARDRHAHDVVSVDGGTSGNGTYAFEVGPMDWHSHVEGGEQWFTAKMGTNHSTSVHRVDYTVCEGFQWWLPGEDPHGCNAPKTVTARVESGAVIVEWADEPYRDEHELTHIVERAPGGTRDFQEIARPPPNASAYRDADVEPGESYHYFVTQLLEGSRSYGYPCDHATITVEEDRPACPEGLQASARSNGDVALSWNASQDAHSYTIYRTATGGPSERVAEVASTIYVDTETTPETTYRYEVRALSEAGKAQGCPTAEVTAIPVFGQPSLVGLAALGSLGAVTVARSRRT